jgi:hypothetical protein
MLQVLGLPGVHDRSLVMLDVKQDVEGEVVGLYFCYALYGIAG